MILRALVRFGYSFRPFRQGPYQNQPSMEELYVIRQGFRPQIKGSYKRLVRTLPAYRDR